jgi:hypothetical protein
MNPSRARTATHEVASPGVPGMLSEKRQQMPRVLNGRLLGPLDLDGRELGPSLDDEIHFSAVFGPEVVQPAPAQILQPLPELDAHPLFERRPGACLDHVGGRRQPGRRVADAEVEKQELRRREERLLGLRENASTRNPTNMSSSNW